jgi:cyclopropane-fatty-acyl-phospholipid synthase
MARLYRDFVGADLPVRIRTWDGSVAGPASGPTVVLNSRRALRRIVARPDELGLARAYVSGDLDVEGDLTEGFRQVWAVAAPVATPATRSLTIADRGRALIAAARLGAIGRPPKPPAVEARIAGKLHTRSRDRAVIAHHYDLSNEFYELILDESMAYSSAVFADPALPLADAQKAKLDRICRQLDLKPGMRLLDVGCGWGSLILHAAEHYGVTATGITLSTRQREFVAKRVAERGLADRVTVSLCDYRDLEIDRPFDAVASIEMGEHVGLENYPAYVTTLFRALAPGGRLLLQQMSRRTGTAPGGGPFIEAYIAPDMHMRPLSETAGFLERAGFEIRSVDNFRSDYALTARRWLENFERNYAALVDLAGDQVARVWRLYLVGGALSFEDGRMGVEQILATR